MSYEIETLDTSTKKFSFKLETNLIEDRLKAAMMEKQKTTNIKGFRKGKAPLNIIKQKYEGELKLRLQNEFIQEELFKAINKEDLHLISSPLLQNIENTDKSFLKFDVQVELYPSIEVKDCSHFSFTKEKIEASEEMIDKTKKLYLESKVTMKELKDESVTLEKGHFAVINYQGEKEDGEKPASMLGEDTVLEIGSGSFIPGFEEGLIGLKKGEKRLVNLTFPANYQEKSLQNTPVKFNVELLEIKVKEYPEFTDEIAKEAGVKSVVDFDKKLKENLLQQSQRDSKSKLHQEIMDKLIEENPCDVPETMVKSQKKLLMDNYRNELMKNKLPEQMLEEFLEKESLKINETALFQVKSTLILNAFSKKFGIEVTPTDFDAKIEEMGLTKEQALEYYPEDGEERNNIMHNMKTEKILKKITEEVTIIEL